MSYDAFFHCVNSVRFHLGWLACMLLYIYFSFVFLYVCMYCKNIYMFFSCCYYVKHDSYFGVLMAYGGLQDVRRSHRIS